MPIRPEQRWFYPIDWHQLSETIRFQRTKGRCVQCGRPHGTGFAFQDHNLNPTFVPMLGAGLRNVSLQVLTDIGDCLGAGNRPSRVIGDIRIGDKNIAVAVAPTRSEPDLAIRHIDCFLIMAPLTDRG